MAELAASTDLSDSQERELALKEREVRAKEREVSVKEAEQKITARRNSVLWGVVGTLLVASLGGFVSWYVSLRQNQSNQELAEKRTQADVELQQQKVKSELELQQRKVEGELQLQRRKVQGDFITEMIRTGSPEKARENLRFWLNTGVIDDPGNRIRKALQQGQAPALPPLSATMLYQPPFGAPVEFEMQVLDKDGRPVPEANISCNSAGSPRETTDATGRFICMIPAGSRTVKVVAEADGYRFSDTVPVDQHTIKLTRRIGSREEPSR